MGGHDRHLIDDDEDEEEEEKDVYMYPGNMMTRPDPDTLPGYPGWSRLVESHCTISRECTKVPHLKEK